MTKLTLARTAKLRANGLLDMLYKPSELADELGIEKQIIYKYLIPAGMPHVRDETENIWLHGPAVAHWIRNMKNDGKVNLEANQAYCLKCRDSVLLVKPKQIHRGMITILQSECPNCGKTVNRGVAR